MKKINIRNYLYHGIQGINCDNGSLYILESILKNGYLVNSNECYKYGVESKINMYLEMGFSPRISLGFYPLEQKIYELSKRRFPNFYGEKIIDKIMHDHNINHDLIDDFIINCYDLNSGCNCIGEDYAWCIYYQGITLILNKEILNDLKISDYGMLADEICIDEPIDVRKYLEFIAVGGIDDLDLIESINNLLEKYNYNCPIIEFGTGQIIEMKTKIR